MTARILDMIVPVVLAAAIGFIAWLVLGITQNQGSLSRADEIRILDAGRNYTEAHAALLREDLRDIRAELAAIRELQNQLLLEMQRREK